MASSLPTNSRAPADRGATPDPHSFRRPESTKIYSACDCTNQTTLIAAANNLTTAAQALAAAASALAAAGHTFRLLGGGGGHFGLDIFPNQSPNYINPPPQPIRGSQDDSDSWHQPSYDLPLGQGGETEQENPIDVSLSIHPKKPSKRPVEELTNPEPTEKKRRKKGKITDDVVMSGKGDAEASQVNPAEPAQPEAVIVAATESGTKLFALKKKKIQLESEVPKVTKNVSSKSDQTDLPSSPKSPESNGSESDSSVAPPRSSKKVSRAKRHLGQMSSLARGDAPRKASGHPLPLKREVDAGAGSDSGPNLAGEESVPDSEA